MPDDDEPRIAAFQPPFPPSSNGAGTRRRRPLEGVAFGFLVGALASATLVDPLRWLNMATRGDWVRPALAAAAAGAMVAVMRRGDLRGATLAGALAALVSLWAVYVLVRLSIRVLFVERSIVRVIAADLGRLALVALPAGALGAAAGRGSRALVRRMVARARGRS